MQVSTRLNGIGEYYFSQKLREIEGLRKQGKDILNLGIGSPDLAPHASVIKVLNEESAKPNVHAYQSYKGSPVLRKGISGWYNKWYGVTLDPETEILPLIGSKEGIMHICMTYLESGDKVLVPNPGYPTYRSAVTLAGGEAINYDLTATNNWYPDFEELEKLATGEKFKLMFVNYPHMPTATLPTKELFERIGAFGKKFDILIIHDNPYSFILNDNPMSLLSVEGAKDVVIELNSLSKSHNMAGWRVGMLVCCKDIID
ncbi:MAG: pyridoxal phosphate-dependent aminotransferase [Flavitalea sp.]